MTTTLLLVCAVLSVGLLTAGAIAVRSVSRIWLRHWVERRLAGASLAEMYLDRPQRLIVSAGTGIALTAYLAGMGALHIGGPTPLTAARLLGVAVAVLLVGQVLPRALARRWPVRVVPLLVPLLRVVDLAVAPMRAVGRRVGALVPGRPARDEAEEARDSIVELLREGELEGVGATQELAIITGVVQFGEKTARDVMRPREQLFALDAALPVAELAAQVAQAGYSRVPLYRGSLDEVVGLVHAFDVLRTEGEEAPPLLPVHAAHAAARCNELLFAMLRARRHLAIVRDDAGRTLGILTLEDLLEELVGDIRDEHDEPAPTERAVTDAADPPR